MSVKICQTIFICVGIVLTILGVTLLGGGFDAIVNAILHAKYQVTPGKEVENIWENIPVPMVMNVYFFNITNPDQFLKGDAPDLVEVGPYVYREYHHKENLTYHPNLTVTYYEKKNWTWDESLSGERKLDDPITVLNAIAVSSAYAVEESRKMLNGLNLLMKYIGEEPFVIKTASEIMFDGYEDPLLDFVQIALDKGIDLPIPPELEMYDKFAWFYKRNNSITYDGVFNMFTGKSSLDDVGIIDWWDYTRESPYFESPCNLIKGSAGELWPPGLTKDFIQFFNSDLCIKCNGADAE